MLRPDFSRRNYPVMEIIDVHDGDTYKLLLDTGGSHGWWPWLRLKDFSCPELSTEAGKVAQAVAGALLSSHQDTVWVVTHRVDRPYKVKRYQDDDQTFSRYVAEVWLDSDLLLGDELVKANVAQKGAFVG